MVFRCINIRQVPWEVLKTAAAGLDFQHLPRDLANVNAWKTMFDPYIEVRADHLRPLGVKKGPPFLQEEPHLATHANNHERSNHWPVLFKPTETNLIAFKLASSWMCW